MTRRYEFTVGLPPRSDDAAYMKFYREHRSDYKERAKAKQNARISAALKVAKKHPREFAKAIADEERKRGIND